ncbi:hypothetical protein IQ266_20790 [filamentous cyanobacterium LEGE 11480]|uniref:Uncharacterized protein n=2 Tax=Romeriopsis TaxID=2992131 RepID=A0A928Z6F6_9CYAN|nr:hypothetical protein [Romeriopsis navalis LEGE 11480]
MAFSAVLFLVEPARSAQPAVGTVQSLVAGDRACYVEILTADGRRTTELASFDICEQKLVGKRVQFTYKSGKVLAASCEGDVDCGKSDTVMLIIEAKVLAERPRRIQDLPDGNYRYWNGRSNQPIVSNDELLEQGGVTFTFRKRGSNITGVFGYIDGEAICVKGEVNGNTVTGTSVQNLSGATVISQGKTFKNFGPSGFMQVRRGRQLSRTIVLYSSTLLNLNDMNWINAGSRVPPRNC